MSLNPSVEQLRRGREILAEIGAGPRTLEAADKAIAQAELEQVQDDYDFDPPEPHPPGSCFACPEWWTPWRKRLAWSLLALLLGALCVGIWGGLQ